MFCRLCNASGDGDAFVRVLDRAEVPVSQNALFTTEACARAARTGELAIRACRSCGFVFNAAFEAGLVPYGTEYENDQTVSAHFADHVGDMARRVLAAARRRDGVVLEVGCGQGYFLRRLQAEAPEERVFLGFDPAWRGEGSDGGLTVHRRFFDADAARELDAQIDVIVSRHVIEHISDPVAFLRVIRAALPDAASVDLFLETPCVEWILERRVLQDFFYEHCSYFRPATLARALCASGFEPLEVEHVFGGQYLWVAARTGEGHAAPTPRAADSRLEPLLSTAADFAAAAERATDAWRSRIATAKRSGEPAAVWGAGAKGVTFTTMVDPEHDLIDCVIDVNPRKQGHFLPLTAHPVVAPSEARDRGVRRVAIMNPNYRDEIARWAAANAADFTFLDA